MEIEIRDGETIEPVVYVQTCETETGPPPIRCQVRFDVPPDDGEIDSIPDRIRHALRNRDALVERWNEDRAGRGIRG